MTDTTQEGATAAPNTPADTAPTRKSTHVMLSATMLEGLDALVQRTRVRQSRLMREAVDDLLARYVNGVRLSPLPRLPPLESTRSLVFRLDVSALESLRALAKRTRIAQSELVREAVADLLAKHAPHPEAPGGTT